MTRFKAMDSEQMIEMKTHRASQLVPTTVMPLITIRTIYTHYQSILSNAVHKNAITISLHTLIKKIS